MSEARSRATGTILLALVVPVIALVAVFATGPDWSAAPAAAQPDAGSEAVTIENFAFSSPTRVAPGTRITVTNRDSTAHTLTSRMPALFDTGRIEGGGTATITAPKKPGRYEAFCQIHDYMTTTIEVTS